MAEIVAYIITPPLLLIAVFCLCFPNAIRKARTPKNPLTVQDCLNIDEALLDRAECRLAEYDSMLQRIKAEQQDTVIAYLDAVRDDYLRVEHLLNRSARFVPELTISEEAARFFLGIKFRLGYRLARLEIRFGFLPAAGLKALTAKLQLAAGWAGQALNEVSREHGLPVLESDLKSGR